MVPWVTVHKRLVAALGTPHGGIIVRAGSGTSIAECWSTGGDPESVVIMTDTNERAGHPILTMVTSVDELAAVTGDADVTAVFDRASPRVADWEAELESAVVEGAFLVPRTELVGVSVDQIATWLDRTLPRAVVARDTRDSLLSELLRLVHIAEVSTATSSFRFRIFVAAPDRRCGFHVDTVAPALPTWGLLRVFNGAGTMFVDPADITSMGQFYHWLHQRDRLVREHAASSSALDASLSRHDQVLSFLRDGAAPKVVPSRTTVAFRHLDVRLHWTDHGTAQAWVHCSPMRGCPRLVVNVSAAHEGSFGVHS